GAEWRLSQSLCNTVQNYDYNDKSWSMFWKKLKEVTGIRGSTTRRSKKACFIIKCLSENLPLLDLLNRRRPDLYESSNCLSCNTETKEVHDHLAECEGYEVSWWNVQSVAAEFAWNNLSKDVRKRLSKQKLINLIFGENQEEMISIRKGLIKGLFCYKAQLRIQKQLRSNRITSRIIEDVLNITWNSFFEIIWKDRCQIVNEWEEKRGIVRKEKQRKKTRQKGEKKKNEESKISEGQKERKEKWKEKVSERLKMMGSLVEEGMLGFIERSKKPFWFGY